MKKCCRKDNLDLKSQILDKKYHFPVLIEAEMKEGEDFPGLRWHSSVFMKNSLVLFGVEDSNDNLNNVFHIFNLKTNKWSQKELKGEQNEIPYPRSSHTANAIGNYIFIIGGDVYDQTDKQVYKIDFDTQKCQIIEEIIEPVYDHTADVLKQSIYIFGGWSINTCEGTSMLQKFNLLTNECEEIKPIGYQPEGRYGHKSIIVLDHLYVFGGLTYPNFFQDLFSINLTNNVSTKIDQRGLIPSPRRDFSFFAFEDKFYLFGGEQLFEYYNNFYSFDVKSSTWVAQETKNQNCLLRRGYHSTVAVKEGQYKLKVYLVGGKESYQSFQKNMNVISFFIKENLYWSLHYLESTGIQTLIGLNMLQEIIELQD